MIKKLASATVERETKYWVDCPYCEDLNDVTEHIEQSKLKYSYPITLQTYNNPSDPEPVTIVAYD